MSANNRKYVGPLGGHLEKFIKEKQNLGCKYVEEERLSFEFDKLSCGYNCSNGVPADLINEFTKFKPNWKTATQKRHISFIQNFGRYLLNHDIQVILPEYSKLRTSTESFVPYIFTHSEIEALFTLADSINPSIRNSHIFYPVLFRLLYCTGLRISEALSLRMRDVDLKNNTIHVVNPKNHKDRVLPISESLAQYCRWYSNQIHIVYRDDDYFFMSNRGCGKYYRNNIQVYFSSMVAKLGLPMHGYKGGSPHLHCLRHTFCIHSLEQMLERGIPGGVALQLLSVYMGHSSLSATARYLQLTAEAHPLLIKKMEEAYSDIFPSIELKDEVRMPYEEE